MNQGPSITAARLLGFSLAAIAGGCLVGLAICIWPLPERSSASLVATVDEMPLARFPGLTPLAPGLPLPALKAEGWINLPPPAEMAGGPRVLLIDVWADWCPVCRDAAPGLVHLFEKHKARSVAFVSLTSAPREKVEAFARHFGVTWPCAYGVSAELITALGAVRPSQNPESALLPGFGPIPTLFIVANDRTIRWHDAAARYRHRDLTSLMAELDREIELVESGSR